MMPKINIPDKIKNENMARIFLLNRIRIKSNSDKIERQIASIKDDFDGAKKSSDKIENRIKSKVDCNTF
jgi:hypothetical protein